MSDKTVYSMMKLYYVYELVNLMGTVEYVGHTENPKRRYVQHTKKLGNGQGKFFGRQDITMHLVSTHPTKKEAIKEELKLQSFWGFENEGEKSSRLRKEESRKGEKNPMSKLNSCEVIKIKKLINQKTPYDKIVKEFNISKNIISLIKNGQRWTHIK